MILRRNWRSTGTRVLVNSLLFLVGLGLGQSAFAVDYYVNDTGTVGDIYCTQPGNDANDGLTPATPVASLQRILNTYPVVTNTDTIFMDTGFYVATGNWFFTRGQSGRTTNDYLEVFGSTNYAAGGTLIDRREVLQPAVTLIQSSFIHFRDLRITGGRDGIYSVNASGNLFENITTFSNRLRNWYFRAGGFNKMKNCIGAFGQEGLQIENSVNTPNYIDNCVFWGHTNNSVFLIEGGGTGLNYISNTVVHADGQGISGAAFALRLTANTDLVGDYNVFFVTNGAALSPEYETLYDRQALEGTDFHSTYLDPRFNRPTDLDFHPLSTSGRYVDGGPEEFDLEDSPLIDLGAPSTPFSNEPNPNGGRVNVGALGGTYKASKSRTGEWLQALTFNDGGVLSGTTNIYWAFSTNLAGSTVRFEVSVNGGSTWTPVALGLSATAGQYLWDPSALSSTFNARWRVVAEHDAGVVGSNQVSFMIRNNPLSFYVNDGSPTGDVYTSAIGSPTNTGFSSSSPLNSLITLLTRYKLSPGDTVYVDTGEYATNVPVQITTFDQGDSNGYVTIQGSTNFAAGCSLFRSTASKDVIEIQSARYINLKDLVLQDGNIGLEISDSDNCLIEGVVVDDNANGFRGNSGDRNVFRNCIAINNSAGFFMSATPSNWFFDNGLMYSNVTSFSMQGPQMYLSNSVVIGGFAWAGTGLDRGDYNIFWDTTLGVFASLNELQTAKNDFWNSAIIDPKMVRHTDFTFHPASTAGRYDILLETFVADAENSPAIDFGAPSADFSREQPDNGGRLNAGPYGNTPFASKSTGNPFLLALSLNDGGTLNAGVDEVFWSYGGGIVSNDLVRIEYSADSGNNWSIVSPTTSVSAGSWVWTDTNYPSSRFGRWKVTLLSNTNVQDANDADFTYKNGVFKYYVNDASLVGDIYTEGVGNDVNLGTDPAAPKKTLASVVATHQLEAGDIIYVDTGLIRDDNTATFTFLDSGTPTNPVLIVGSTNETYGGSIITRQSSLGAATDALRFESGAHDILVQNLNIWGRGNAVSLQNSTNIDLRWIGAASNFNSMISSRSSSNITIRNSYAHKNASNGVHVITTSYITIMDSVLNNNSAAGVKALAGITYVSNCVIKASGNDSYGYFVQSAGNIQGNYNCLFTENQAFMAYINSGSQFKDSLAAWQTESGQESLSLNREPRFADEAGLDFHLRTEAFEGRYDVVNGLVNDADTSPCINAGDPSRDCSSENDFAQCRINIGRYGNTDQASLATTEASLQVGSLGGGGAIAGNYDLHWTTLNLTNGAAVTVEVSSDGGSSWTVLDTVPGTNEVFSWDTTLFENSPAGLWRVVSADPEVPVSDATTNFFSIRNSPLTLYVNDASTDGDQFTTAIGSATNFICSTNAPFHSVEQLINLFDLEPGDTVYVDTGIYTNGNNLVVGPLDSGNSFSEPVQFVGAYGCEGVGPQIKAASTASGKYGLFLQEARFVAFSNMYFHSGHHGVYVLNSDFVRLSHIQSVNNFSNGFRFYLNGTIEMRNSVAANNPGNALFVQTNTAVHVDSSVFWSNKNSTIWERSAYVYLSNSVLEASEPGTYIYDIKETVVRIRSDYNNLVVNEDNGAAFALINVKRDRSNLAWFYDSTNDAHSLTHDPKFKDSSILDFHPLSTEGRYEPTNCSFILDAEVSPLLDSGMPSHSFDAETSPNGNRKNIGLYGSTSQGSRSATNAYVIALTANDGGIMRGTNNLHWVAGGAATSHLVYLEFSPDGGSTWTNIVGATNLPASLGAFFPFDVSDLLPTPFAQWRITSQSDTNISDIAGPFTISGSLDFYVNDDDTNCDVYALAAGNANFDGLDPATPAPSLAAILQKYELTAGSRVFIDTGTYATTNPLTFDINISGEGTNKIQIIGSTNATCGNGQGSVLDGLAGNAVIFLNNASDLVFKNLQVKNAQSAILVDKTTNVLFEGITVVGGAGFKQNVYGFELTDSAEIEIRNSVVAAVTNAGGAAAGVYLESAHEVFIDHSVLWSNGIGIRVEGGADVSLSNSVIGAFGSLAVGMSLHQEAIINGSDYNDHYHVQGAIPFLQGTEIGPNLDSVLEFETLSRWKEVKGHDTYSLSAEPYFYNPGQLDFHLQSISGRYEYVSGTFSGLDGINSPLIDAGAPTAEYTNEVSDNGGVINIGRYGNTPQASLSSSAGDLTIISRNDGGNISGTNVVLRWIPKGAVLGHTLRVDFSSDNGFTWTNLALGINGTNTQYIWDSTQVGEALKVLWRVQSLNNPLISDQSDAMFGVRNAPFSFYVNDTNLLGDVYCTAAGHSLANGASPSSPMDSLELLLDTYNLEPGDTVYIDTGIYTNDGMLIIPQSDAGSDGTPVSFIGSTNRYFQGDTNLVAYGTVFNGFGLQLSASRGAALENLSILAANQNPAALLISQSTNTTVKWVKTEGGGDGLRAEQSANTYFNHCVSFAALSNGASSIRAVEVRFENGILWSNPVGFAVAGFDGSISNSIIGVYGQGSIALRSLGLGSELISDYNSVFHTNGALVGELFDPDFENPRLYENVGTWALRVTNDTHSLSHLPAFADVTARDFHLKSEQGRYDPVSQTFIPDAETSVLIDAGDPLVDISQEPSPNGGRINIGLYGNTPEASLSPDTPRLTAVSYSDSGVASATNISLYWVPYGTVTDCTYSIDLSIDGGSTWSNMAAGLGGSVTEFSFLSALVPDTPLALWRVVSDCDTGVYDVVDYRFTIRKVPLRFYVNDTNTFGDVYSTAAGTTNNLGISSNEPNVSLQYILDSYDIEPGDLIFIDTGQYETPATISIGQLDAGSLVPQYEDDTNTHVFILGSTNYAAGGSIFDRRGGTPVISLFEAEAVLFSDLVMSNYLQGIILDSSSDCIFNKISLRGGLSGISISEGTLNTIIRRIDVSQTLNNAVQNTTGSSETRIENSVFWSNRTYSVDISSGNASISNSIFSVYGKGAVAVRVDQARASLSGSDYNCYDLRDGALLSDLVQENPAPLPIQQQNVSRWYRDTGYGEHSISKDPYFVDPVNYDFHLRSVSGQYDPSLQSFVVGTNTSPLIDAGNPLSQFGAESAPNGNRLNIGKYGNSAEASRSSTNPVFNVLSFNDGGRAEGIVKLYWVPTGAATGHTVSVRYSYNGGLNWETVQTNVPARSGLVFWDTTQASNTVIASWMVVSDLDTNIYDASDSLFSIRNQPLSFYVNDSSTAGDIYTLAKGNDSNTGMSPSDPRLTVSTILNDYDLEPGDEIFVDAGAYQYSDGINVSRFDAWEEMTNLVALQNGAHSLIIRGSTNESAKTYLTMFNGASGVTMTQALGVLVRDITFLHDPAGNGSSVRGNESDYLGVNNVQSFYSKIAFDFFDTEKVYVDHSVSVGAADYGVSVDRSADIFFEDGLLWTNRNGTLVSQGGELSVSNTIFGSTWTGMISQLIVDGTLNSDYNAYYTTNGGLIGGLVVGTTIGGGTNPLEKLHAWYRATGQDSRSFWDEIRLADVEGRDFHLMSPAGRYDSTYSSYVTNVLDYYSPLIDAGNKGSVFVQETEPNGARINIGLYGNTDQATLSSTDSVLQVLTFNDGGSTYGENTTLRWVAKGGALDDLVTVLFSANGGGTWSNIAVNIPSTSESVFWVVTNFPKAAAGLWRVCSQSDTNICDVNDYYFKNPVEGGLDYYINDASTECDIYCTAPGSSENDGFLPSSPKNSLQSLLDAIDFEGGDRVYIDTGTYATNVEILVGALDAGSFTNYVQFVGATNCGDCGTFKTVFSRITGVGNVIRPQQTEWLKFKNITVKNGDYGITLDQAGNCAIENVHATDNELAGVFVSQSSDAIIENSFLYGNSSNGIVIAGGQFGPADATIDHSVIYDNATAIQLGAQGAVSVSNTIMEANGPDERIYKALLNAGGIVGDYNNIIRRNNASVAERIQTTGGNEFYPTLIDWYRGSSQDVHTASFEPDFVDVDSGEFHLKSSVGRINENCIETNDALFGDNSLLIDMGNPGDPSWTNEPSPNGGRINIGGFGGTEYASYSRTNPWVTAITMNDGGYVNSNPPALHWTYGGGLGTDTLVRIELARDGIDYDRTIISNISVASSPYVWPDACIHGYRPTAKYRITVQTNETVSDEVDKSFGIICQPPLIYVNDASTVGDVYCTAPGDEANDGLGPDRPLNDPATALQKYIMFQGGVLYIDTGVYPYTNKAGMVVGVESDAVEQGVEGDPITILGSTNFNAGGTVIAAGGTNGWGLLLDRTKHIEVKHLKFRNTDIGLRVVQSLNINLENIQGYENAEHGMQLVDAPATLYRGAFYENDSYGINLVGGQSVLDLQQATIWSNAGGGVLLNQGTLFATNCIFHSYASNSPALLLDFASYSGDYNWFIAEDLGVLANDLILGIYENLRAFQDEPYSTDKHSLSLADTGQLLAGTETFSGYFPDAENGDFHPFSENGRFNYGTGTFVNDGETSWTIDFGSPQSSYSKETFPHGNRVNIGYFGNTPEASRSATTPGLLLVSLNDGGLTGFQDGGTQVVYWLSRGLSTSETVRLEYSWDNALSWEFVTTNHPITEPYEWYTKDFQQSQFCFLRISLNSDTNIWDQNDESAKCGGDPVFYYVNDAQTNGDYYTTAPGDIINTGLSNSHPLPSLQDVLLRYDINGLDKIFIDTGIYTTNIDVTITAQDAGGTNGPVSIIGSPYPGDTVLLRDSTNAFFATEPDAILRTEAADYLNIHNITFEDADVCLSIDRFTDQVLISNVLVRGCGQAGINLESASKIKILNSIITKGAGAGVTLNGAAATIENTVIWSNGPVAVNMTSSSLGMTNSVLWANGVDTNALVVMDVFSTLRSDFNSYVVQGNARYIIRDGVGIDGIPQISKLLTNDLYTLSVDPKFNDASNEDFHLISGNGRYDPSITNYVYEDGTNFSLLIDTGSTNIQVGTNSWASEPVPNGSNINIGVYGGTVEASVSPTNPWLHAITGSGGGRAADLFLLTWAWGQQSPTNTISIDISLDNGLTFSNLVGGLPVGNGAYAFESRVPQKISSPLFKWRVVSETIPGLMDETDTNCFLNGPFTFFVNNNDQVGDMYTTAIGNDNNSGLSSNSPMASLKNLLTLYDLEGGDVVLMDAGVYPLSTNLLTSLGPSDAGNGVNNVVVKGSTNRNTTLYWTEGEDGPILLTINALYCEVDSLNFFNGGLEAAGTNFVFRNITVSNAVVLLTGRAGEMEDFTLIDSDLQAVGQEFTMSRIRAKNSGVLLAGQAITVDKSVFFGDADPLVLSSGTNIVLESSTLVGAATAFQQSGEDSSTTLRNNILIADGANVNDAYCILLQGGVLVSDFNNFVTRNNAWVGTANGSWERLLYWQQNSGLDTNSMSFDPLFVDENGEDFHLQSLTGYYDVTGFAASVQHSPLIDAGNPGFGFDGEPSPNGSRLNLGGYGDTAQASLSVSQPSLTAVTLNDGGAIEDSITLVWIANNLSSTNTVRLYYSSDGGNSYGVVATNIPYNQEFYQWDTTSTADSFNAYWRVCLEQQTNICDSSDERFSVRNTPQNFFVNDSSTADDFYTSGPGNPLFAGLNPFFPAANLMNILTNYDIQGDDTIYVDTGIYSSAVDNIIIWSDGGKSGSYVRIIGSPNMHGSGTYMFRGNNQAASQDVFDVKGSYVKLYNLTVAEGYRGVFFDSNRFVTAERVFSRDNQYGFEMRNTFNTTVKNARVVSNRIGVDAKQSVSSSFHNISFAHQTQFDVVLSQSEDMNIFNNIFYHSVTGTTAIAGDTGTVNEAFIDYNVYYFTPAAAPNSFISGNYQALLEWQRDRGMDYRSAILNPEFNDATGDDFTLKSSAGRYDLTNGWVNDAESSWAIDRGAPWTDYNFEPATNGHRVNIGAFGNTPFASKGSTNLIIEIRTASDSDLLLDPNLSPYPLIWYVLNLPTNIQTVTVQFSGDQGTEWTTIEENVPADQEFILWDIGPEFNSFRGKWRVLVDLPTERYTFFTNNLDVDPGWSTEGQWSFGAPTGSGGTNEVDGFGEPDPSAGFTGGNVYGYNLAGNYAADISEQRLTAGPFDLSNYGSVKLTYERWLGVGASPADNASVQVSTNGVNYEPVWTNSTQMDGGAWTAVEHDLPIGVDYQTNVWIQWVMGSTDSSMQYAGWNIDDIRLTGLQALDATNTEEIVVDFGTFEMQDINVDHTNSVLEFRGWWDENYQLQYAETRVGSHFMWTNVLSASTNLALGGDTAMRDPTATGRQYRVYRVIWDIFE